MKNLLLTLLACLLSFGLTTLCLHQYGHTIFENTQKATVNTSENNSDEITDNSEEQTESDEPEIVFTPNVEGSRLEKNYKDWRNYTKNSIELSYEFKAIDTDNSIIEKDEFLTKLKTGLYIPLKVDEGDYTYKLYELTENTNKKISKSIKGLSSMAYHYFKKEGVSLPDFNFTDLNGNNYTKKNTAGKIKIIKCWFINCVVCVQEFPELNKLYDRYEVNENVIFLSLAFDDGEKLKKFLSKKEFRYPVIPNQKKYMAKDLEVKQYPTHIIVDEDNHIIKMVNNVDALTTIVNYLISSQESREIDMDNGGNLEQNNDDDF